MVLFIVYYLFQDIQSELELCPIINLQSNLVSYLRQHRFVRSIFKRNLPNVHDCNSFLENCVLYTYLSFDFSFSILEKEGTEVIFDVLKM